VVLTRAAYAIALSLALAACDSKSATTMLDLGTQAQIGLEFVQQRGCAMCHQSSRDSDGILAGQTTPMPGTSHVFGSNLTSDITTGIGGWADIEIVRAMRSGVDNTQAPLCPPMPHYDGSDAKQAAMTDVEAAAIVAYLRALPPVSRAIPPSLCPPLKPQPNDMATAHD
jgi:hypothetical protein